MLSLTRARGPARARSAVDFESRVIDKASRCQHPRADGGDGRRLSDEKAVSISLDIKRVTGFLSHADTVPRKRAHHTAMIMFMYSRDSCLC